MGGKRGRVFGAALAAVVVAGAGRSRGSLSRDGAATSAVVGTLTVGGGGWWWGTLLVAFFATSSVLSKVDRGERVDSDRTIRGSERDAVQVLANGAVPTALAVLTGMAPPGARALLFGGYAGAVAAAAAGTWATELGHRSSRQPRLIVGGAPVRPGTSGGVTPLGDLASVAGAGLIALLAASGTKRGWAPGSWRTLPWGTLSAGVAGSAADSLLGATVQAAYRCPRCGEPTERRLHRCGTPTLLVRGNRAISNDAVNAAATAVGAVVRAMAARASR